jgi:hypothetical protein
VSNRQVQINEGDAAVDTTIQVQQGDTLIFQVWGTIWAGVWGTSTNGPQGWSWRDNDQKFPLPGAHPFQLLGLLDTGYFEIGRYRRLDQTPDQGTLFLEINDDAHGNGNGAFQCMIQHYRNV